eukprot:302743_1
MMLSLSLLSILFVCVTSSKHPTISKSAREYQLGSNEMSKCYKTQLDHNNPSHSCKYIFQQILSNQTYISNDTSCISSVFDILPVQYCVGASISNCKKNMFETMIYRSITEYITYQNNNPTPAMLYYKNNTNQLGIYVFNHQHMATALAESQIIPNKLKYLKICIVTDLRKLFTANEPELFWNYMIEMGYSYPYNEYYEYRNPVEYMPLKILELVDDPFRSLSEYVEDYEGFVYCGNPQSGVNAANYSKCFGKKGVKWNRKYDDVGLALLWSNFLYHKLINNNFTKHLYTAVDIYKQMHWFRKILPIAMKIALNRSDGSHKLPSFNNQPWKVNMSDLVLFDNGCDLMMQQSTNWTQLLIVNNNNVNKVMENKLLNINVDFAEKYLVFICVVGVIAAIIRFCRIKMNIDNTYNHILGYQKGYGTIS